MPHEPAVVRRNVPTLTEERGRVPTSFIQIVRAVAVREFGAKGKRVRDELFEYTLIVREEKDNESERLYAY
jgi:hypothetical protein